MYFSDSITLRAVVTGIDADGYPTTTPVDTVVYSNRLSATRSEFYAAQANNILVTQSYEVHSEDWANQTQIIDGEKTYKIERSYQKGLGVWVLTCSDKAV